MGSNYVPLARLVEEWARQGGELPQTVLTSLCEHEARGRLPAEAFRHSGSGEPAARGMLSELAGLVRSSGYRVLRDDAARDLDAVVLSKAHVLEFCRANGIRPPRCVAGFWGWLLWRGALHRSPPPPALTAEELQQREVTRLAAEAHYDAQVADEIEVALSWMQQCLSRLRGQRAAPEGSSGLSADRSRAAEPAEFWEFTKKEFERHASTARFYLDQGVLTDGSRAAELRARFDALEADYAPTKAPLQAVGANIGSRRPLGRPPGSGSLKAADAPLVEEMRRLMEADRTLSRTAAAMCVAGRAAGGGTDESKASRLVQRYSEKYGPPNA